METGSTSTQVSPEKRSSEKKIGTRLQLYNATHKVDLLKLFTNVRKFTVASTSVAEPAEMKGEVVGVGAKIPLGDFAESSSDDDEQEQEDLSVGDDDALIQHVIDGKSKFDCRTCAATFTELSDLRAHYRLDWHRYNVKRKLHGQSAVAEGVFDDMIGKAETDRRVGWVGSKVLMMRVTLISTLCVCEFQMTCPVLKGQILRVKRLLIIILLSMLCHD
jgi:hypothetical protein